MGNRLKFNLSQYESIKIYQSNKVKKRKNKIEKDNPHKLGGTRRIYIGNLRG